VVVAERISVPSSRIEIYWLPAYDHPQAAVGRGYLKGDRNPVGRTILQKPPAVGGFFVQTFGSTGIRRVG